MPELCQCAEFAEFSKLRIFLRDNPAEICRDLGRGINLPWEGFLDAPTDLLQKKCSSQIHINHYLITPCPIGMVIRSLAHLECYRRVSHLSAFRGRILGRTDDKARDRQQDDVHHSGWSTADGQTGDHSCGSKRAERVHDHIIITLAVGHRSLYPQLSDYLFCRTIVD